MVSIAAVGSATAAAEQFAVRDWSGRQVDSHQRASKAGASRVGKLGDAAKTATLVECAAIGDAFQHRARGIERPQSLQQCGESASPKPVAAEQRFGCNGGDVRMRRKVALEVRLPARREELMVDLLGVGCVDRDRRIERIAQMTAPGK